MFIVILAWMFGQEDAVTKVLGGDSYLTYIKLTSYYSSKLLEVLRFIYPEECFSAPLLEPLHMKSEYLFMMLALVVAQVALVQIYLSPCRSEHILSCFISFGLGMWSSWWFGCYVSASLGIFLYFMIRAFGYFKVNYYVMVVGMLWKCDKPFSVASITAYVFTSWTINLVIFALLSKVPYVKDFAKRVLKEEAASLNLNQWRIKWCHKISKFLLLVFVLYLVVGQNFNESDWRRCVIDDKTKIKAYKHRNRLNFWMAVALVLLLTLQAVKDLVKESSLIPKQWKQGRLLHEETEKYLISWFCETLLPGIIMYFHDA